MKLVDIQYDRNDVSFERGKFRVRGDCVEIWPSYEEYALHIELWGDEIDQLSLINPTSGETIATQDRLFVYPAKHFVMPEERIEQAVTLIKQELDEQLERFRLEGKLLEAQRLSARTRFDIEMLLETGVCPGIENYSRPLSGARRANRPPRCTISFPRLPAVRRRVARDRAADPRDVCRATRAANGRWWNTDSGCPARWTTARCGSRSGSSACTERVRVGHAQRLRAAADGRRGGRTDHPAHGAARPDHRDRAGAPAGGAPAGADPPAGGRRRTRAGDGADQAAGRGPVCVLHRTRASPASGSTANWMPSNGWICCATCAKGASMRWSA